MLDFTWSVNIYKSSKLLVWLKSNLAKLYDSVLNKKTEPFYYCHKFQWNFTGLDTHREWLFSFIIVMVSLKKKKKKKKKKKNQEFLRIFFTVIWYPNLGLVLC